MQSFKFFLLELTCDKEIKNLKFFPIVMVGKIRFVSLGGPLSPGSLSAPFSSKPSLVHFLFYCWSLHPVIRLRGLISNICHKQYLEASGLECKCLKLTTS